MRERIRRIVNKGRGDARIGKRGGFLIAVSAVLALAGVASAQYHVPEHDWVAYQRNQERAEQREQAMAGRRNVLMRLLEQLHEQARQTETALHEHEQRRDEEARVMQSELETLHDQIRSAERGLGDLDQREGPPEVRALSERLQHLKEQAENIERELIRLGDSDPGEARELREALERTHQEIRAVEEELHRSERDRERERPEAPRFRPPAEANVHELMRQAEELQAQIAETRVELGEVQEAGKISPEEARELAAALRSLQRRTREFQEQLERRAEIQKMEPLYRGLRQTHAQMQAIKEELAEFEREQEELHADRTLETEVEQLRGQVSQLRESTQQTNELLEELLSMDSPNTVGSAGQYWRW